MAASCSASTPGHQSSDPTVRPPAPDELTPAGGAGPPVGPLPWDARPAGEAGATAPESRPAPHGGWVTSGQGDQDDRKGTRCPTPSRSSDDRTGKKVTVPIDNGTFPSSALRELDPDLRIYDPAFLSTAACASAITYLDGDAGILRYRGYPIEQLAEQSTYLEVAYLLLNGELPDAKQLEQWVYDVTHHTFIHDNVRKRFMEGFHYDAHPMGMLVSGLAALSTFYPEAKDIFDPDNRDKQILRLIAKMPTLAACCHRFSVGMPFVYPDNDLSYPANFLNMMWKVGEYEVDPVLEHALDVLFILHADHEQNCGTTAMRVVGSSHADPYSAAAAAPRRCTARSTAAPTRPSSACSPRSARWTTCRRSSTT